MEGVPTLPRGAFFEPTLSKKRAKSRALLAACDGGMGWYWLLGPTLFEERPSVFDVFWQARVVYFWVLPMPGELLPHWVVIDRASLFWQRWGFGALVLRLKGNAELTDWRLGVVWYGNRLVWRRASVGGRMHAVWYWSRENEAWWVDAVGWPECEWHY